MENLDKIIVQGRFNWLKQKEPTLNSNANFAKALIWLKNFKESGSFARWESAWREAPLKRGDVAALLARCRQTNSFSEAVRLVGSLFCDPIKLGKCFPLPLSESFAVENTGDDDLDNFDWKESDNAVRELIAASPAIANAMSYALLSLASEIAALGSTIVAGDGRMRAMRIMLVAEDVPNVSRSQILQALVSAPKEAIGRLANSLRRTWGIEVCVPWLQTIISEAATKRGLTLSFEDVAIPMFILRELWAFNATNPKQTAAIPASQFVNRDIAKLAEEDNRFLTKDFLTWFAEKQSNRIQTFCQCPFILDTASKSHILQVAAEIEHQQHFHQAYGGGDLPFLVIRIRRNHLVEDTMSQLARASKFDLHKPLKVQFVGEEGVDAGGVRKEYFLLMLRQLLDPSFGMFRMCDPSTKLLWFNPDSLEAHLQFELVGCLIGLAISNRVIVDVPFPRVLYKLLLENSETVSLGLGDLEELDPRLYHGFQELLEFQGDVESTFCRTFEASRESWGAIQEFELVPGGSKIPVTNSNREEFVRVYATWYLVESVRSQFSAFRKGFFSVMDENLVKSLLFTPEELELLVVGVRSLDFQALEMSASYDDGYDENSITIKTFWRVAHSLSDDDKRMLLKFITGSDRVPIRGLGDVHIVISRAGSDPSLLPASHTCFDHLLLPDYGSDEELMRSRLKLALEHSEGFFTR